MLLFEDATRGELELRRGRHMRWAQVAVMRSSPDILELILGKQTHADGLTYHLRVYFTEPIDEPDTLLALSVEWKQNYPAGRLEQDLHVQQAHARFERHCLARHDRPFG